MDDEEGDIDGKEGDVDEGRLVMDEAGHGWGKPIHYYRRIDWCEY